MKMLWTSLHLAFISVILDTTVLGLKDQDSVQQILQAALDKHCDFWNMTVSVAYYNKSFEVAAASGFSDYTPGQQRKMTVNDSIPSGSATKMFTAVSVLRLVDKGFIDLDDFVAPLIDQYLAMPISCESEPAYCADTCVPWAYCFDRPDSKCESLSSVQMANCSYCFRTLHCHCNDSTACPSKITFQQLFGQQNAVQKITFRQCLSMQSGLQDYYFDL